MRNGWGVRRIVGNGRVTGIELKKCTRVFNDGGQFSPVYDETRCETVHADQIIVAIGQMSDAEFLNHTGLETVRGGFKVDLQPA